MTELILHKPIWRDLAHRLSASNRGALVGFTPSLEYPLLSFLSPIPFTSTTAPKLNLPRIEEGRDVNDSLFISFIIYSVQRVGPSRIVHSFVFFCSVDLPLRLHTRQLHSEAGTGQAPRKTTDPPSSAVLFIDSALIAELSDVISIARFPLL